METAGGGSRWPRAVWLAAGALGVTIALALSLGFIWARDAETPRVTVLGSGKGLSVLVTSGPARLLVVAGDDAAAFENALAQARHPTERRVDILLLSGAQIDLSVVARAKHDLGARYVNILGGGSSLRDLGLTAADRLTSVRRFRLPGSVSVTAEVKEVEATSTAGARTSWSVLVQHGETAVFVLSDGKDVEHFANPGRVSALVLAGGDPGPAVKAIDAAALVVSSTAVSGKQSRREVAQAAGRKLWGLRLHPGDIARLDFVANGLRLPTDATVVDGTTGRPAPSASVAAQSVSRPTRGPGVDELLVDEGERTGVRQQI